jgi:ubiquitin conjugation factor E4 B
MLINDATYLLDEVLHKLEEIHTIEVEMQDRQTWESQPEVRAQRQTTRHTPHAHVHSAHSRLKL